MRWLFILCFTVISCGNPDPELLLQHLPGYWEIEKVQLPNGDEKMYSINLNIDYIAMNGNRGIRKKVQPKLDGTFLTFDQNETFTALVRNDSLILQYKTPFSEWEESVLTADGARLVILNNNGKKFFYKPYEPLTLD